MTRISSVAAALLLAATACSSPSPGVTVGSASPISTPSDPVAPGPASDAPDTTGPGSIPGAGSTSSSTGSTPTSVGEAWPGAPARGLGDPLFPNLGAPGLDAQHYDVQLDYDPSQHRITGVLRLTVIVTVPAPELALDAGPDVTVGSVALDGTPIPAATHVDGELVVPAPAPMAAGSQHVVDVRWTTTPRTVTGGDGIAVGWFPTTDGSWTLHEPNGLSTWMPANDHPSDKATWTFTLDVPSGITGVANGVLSDHQTIPSGERWVWDETDPMSSYLVLVLTGHYDVVEGTGPNGVRLEHTVLSSEHAAAQPAIDLTPAMIDFFDGQFGPYPFPVYGLALTDSVPGLAMEDQTRSMFRATDVAGELTGNASAQLLLAHELAHQWFGDAVSPAAWQDTWLNEGFATYGEWLWLDHVGLGSLTDSADQALAQHRSFPPSAPSAATMFDPEVYQGGAVVLHALREELGDTTFFTLLRRWVAEHRGTAQTTATFIAFAGQVAGRDLSGFFATWLSTTTPPAAYPKS